MTLYLNHVGYTSQAAKVCLIGGHTQAEFTVCEPSSGKVVFTGQFAPATPFLPGAVTNGISGDAEDKPQLNPGSYQECEYWTPMAAFTLWLLSELRK